jgi:hypothetical protein
MPDANPPIAIVSHAVHEESTLEAFPGSPIFAPLPMIAGGWACIACDTPLPKGQGRAPSRHYRTHSLELNPAIPRVITKGEREGLQSLIRHRELIAAALDHHTGPSLFALNTTLRRRLRMGGAAFVSFPRRRARRK